MEPDRRPHVGSIVVREAPLGGGVLIYLGRDAAGRARWVDDVEAAEVHPTMREATRAALLAPPSAGANRPAYAVPASVLWPEASAAPPVADPPDDPPAAGPPQAPPPALTEPAEPPAPPVVAALAVAAPVGGLLAVWVLWCEAWMALLFRSAGSPGRSG
jgi:hypothetical protein